MFEGGWNVFYYKDSTTAYWTWKAYDERELYFFQGTGYATRAAARRGWKLFSRRLGITKYTEVIV